MPQRPPTPGHAPRVWYGSWQRVVSSTHSTAQVASPRQIPREFAIVVGSNVPGTDPCLDPDGPGPGRQSSGC